MVSSRLTGKQKAVFVLKEMEDCDTKEIARILACGESTVRNHLFNARRILRRELAGSVRGSSGGGARERRCDRVRDRVEDYLEDALPAAEEVRDFRATSGPATSAGIVSSRRNRRSSSRASPGTRCPREDVARVLAGVRTGIALREAERRVDRSRSGARRRRFAIASAAAVAAMTLLLPGTARRPERSALTAVSRRSSRAPRASRPRPAARAGRSPRTPRSTTGTPAPASKSRGWSGSWTVRSTSRGSSPQSAPGAPPRTEG